MISANNLSSGNSTSCGCFRWKGHNEISGCYWKSLQNRSKKKNIPYSITIQQAWDLYVQQNGKCALTGLDLTFVRNYCAKIGRTQTASLDRIDSKRGYEIGNVQWVHKAINRLKNNLKEEDFQYWCKVVSEFNSKKINQELCYTFFVTI